MSVVWTPEWFGVDRDVLRRVLSALSERGADHGEIFLQHARTTRVMMEDGILGRAEVHVEHGAGLRAVVGDRVGYAFTEDLSERSLTEAARTAAGIAKVWLKTTVPVTMFVVPVCCGDPSPKSMVMRGTGRTDSQCSTNLSRSMALTSACEFS